VAFTSYTVANPIPDSSEDSGNEPVEEVNGIYVANASGSGVPSMIISPSGDNLTWSPDGEKIAFYYHGGIEVIKDDDNGQWDRIGPFFNDLEDAQPPYSWSPDGKRIAFVAMFDSDLYVIDTDGSGRKRLANTIPYSPNSPDYSIGSDPSPIWSPDAKKIAFICPAPPGSKGSDLCMINADGTEWKRLALEVV
jgi:Tol biopolymer transport system component